MRWDYQPYSSVSERDELVLESPQSGTLVITMDEIYEDIDFTEIEPDAF